MTGIGLMKLNDIDGATAAFGQFEIDLANPDYPRPDFDAVYNLARLSAQLGDVEQAKRLYQVHHRLTLRAGLPSLAVYDARLCAMAAEASDAPQDVLQCLEPYGESLGEASFLAAQLLPARAIARARTGQIAGARSDLEQIRRRAAVDRFREEGRSEITHVEAEILFAEGRASEAFVKLRDHARQDRIADARRFSGGIRQVTGDMQHQLTERRAQLETARSNTRLQGVLLAFCVIFVLSAFAALLWMWSRAAARGGSQPVQVRVPGQYEPRNPHAAEWGGGHGRRPDPRPVGASRAGDGRGYPVLRRNAGAVAL
jgi:hypothetical protein